MSGFYQGLTGSITLYERKFFRNTWPPDLYLFPHNPPELFLFILLNFKIKYDIYVSLPVPVLW
jgi:hypothetical protein